MALVGGAVRDGLLHHKHQDPWRGLPDLDLVVEGCAITLAQCLQEQCGPIRVPELRVHGAYGTAELVLDGVLLDLASARQEHYPAPGHNPVVEPGRLEQDLLRRDFSVNAMALVLQEDEKAVLLDGHGGQADLAARRLNFLHAGSMEDDPTRLIRAARYGARLGFSLGPKAADQIASTLRAWPWSWLPGQAPEQAPPALATRLRMELELLLEREPWVAALALLQSWGGLQLLDAALQGERRLTRRLQQAQRLGLPLLTVLVAGATDPSALAQRLQLPLQQQRHLQQQQDLLAWLRDNSAGAAVNRWNAAEWSEELEARSLAPEAVALAVLVLLHQPTQQTLWRPLLRWWGRWRHLQAPLTARQLMAQGWQSGPALGQELRRLRRQRLVEQR